MFDPALLNEVATPASGGGPVRLLDHHPVTSAVGERLRRAIDHLDRFVLADRSAAR